jgi:hypothetical protein
MESNTTRKHPRTLEEAFPQDGHQAQWFFPPEHKHGWLDRLVRVVVNAIKARRKHVSNR